MGALDKAKDGLLTRSAPAFRALPTNVHGLVPPRSADIGFVRLAGSVENFGHVVVHDLPYRGDGLVRRRIRDAGLGGDLGRGAVAQERIDDPHPFTFGETKTSDRMNLSRRPFVATFLALALAMAAPDRPRVAVSAFGAA